MFPCRPGDKRPAVKDWEQKACADPDRVARYWPAGQHNVGIACGPSRLVVVDLDTHGALPDDWRLPGIRDGRDVFAQLLEWAGEPWPVTYTVATPSGGWHLYFTAPDALTIRNSASRLGPLVDVRGQGGYVVGAGSVVDGKPYELLDDSEPAPLPGWIGRLLTESVPPPVQLDQRRAGRLPGNRIRGLLRAVSDAPEGQRNAVCYWSARRAAELVAAGETDAVTVCEAIISAAVTAGLPENEARRTVASGMRGGDR